MLISCFKLCSAALILKTECVVISQWLSVCVCVCSGLRALLDEFLVSPIFSPSDVSSSVFYPGFG